MSQHYKLSEVKRAIQQSYGMVYVAARILNCTPNTIYRFIRKYPSCAQAQEEARGTILDEAELQLMQQVRAGEQWAIKFILATQGRERGYMPRSEYDPSDDDRGGDLSIMALAKLAAAAEEQERKTIDGDFKVLDDPDKGSTNGSGADTS
jgi:hypothetical protein